MPVQSNARGELSLVCLLKWVHNVTLSAGLTKTCTAGFLSLFSDRLVFPKLFWQAYWRAVVDDVSTADSTWLESRFYLVLFPKGVIQISAPISLALLCKRWVWISLLDICSIHFLSYYITKEILRIRLSYVITLCIFGVCMLWIMDSVDWKGFKAWCLWSLVVVNHVFDVLGNEAWSLDHGLMAWWNNSLASVDKMICSLTFKMKIYVNTQTWETVTLKCMYVVWMWHLQMCTNAITNRFKISHQA